MSRTHSFKFLDDGLNRELVSLLKKAGIAYSLDEDGVVHYSAADQEVVENDLICPLRDQIFPSWQVLTCPGDWIARYQDYMSRRRIPFRQELSNGNLWFLIPRTHRPHLWKLDGPIKKERVAKEKQFSRSTPRPTD